MLAPAGPPVAFVAPVGFLMPRPVAGVALAAPPATAGPAAGQPVAGATHTPVASRLPVPIAALASVVGFVAGVCLAGERVAATRRRVHVHGGQRPGTAGTRLRALAFGTPALSPTPGLQPNADAEARIAEFVPKIAALRSHAQALQDGELRDVLRAVKAQKHPELRGMFGEVDELLGALIDAIHSLRDSALMIRNSEVRQQLENMDRDAQAWVGSVERGAIESLAGYSPARYEAAESDAMMEVHVVGLSHHSAPVEVREKLAVAEADWNNYARELVEFSRTANECIVPEVSVISTCNRFELYFASPEMKGNLAIECVQAFLRHKAGLSREEIDLFLFTYSGAAAANHLFEVSSGLDSLVLGEAQILSQLKACYRHCTAKAVPGSETAAAAGSGGKIIAKMFNAGIRTGKLVRTRTRIGQGTVSVSSAAVELMLMRSMADLQMHAASTRAVVVGAGKMARLLLLALFSKHPDIHVTVVSRSAQKAEDMLNDDMVAKRGGRNARVVPWSQMLETVRNSDVVFTATGSKEPIIHVGDLQDLGRKLMLIDISVPLNVDADCVDVPGVQSYNIDDLKRVQEANAEKRQAEASKARRLIAEEVGKFKTWQNSQGAVAYLASLQARAEAIRQAETEKASRKLSRLHETERRTINKLTRHIIDKMLEPMYYSLKDDEDISEKRRKIWALKTMFKLKPLIKRRLPSSQQASA